MNINKMFRNYLQNLMESPIYKEAMKRGPSPILLKEIELNKKWDEMQNKAHENYKKKIDLK